MVPPSLEDDTPTGIEPDEKAKEVKVERGKKIE
jgi:hypothetical protein